MDLENFAFSHTKKKTNLFIINLAVTVISVLTSESQKLLLFPIDIETFEKDYV